MSNLKSLRAWLHGLISAAIGGAAGAIADAASHILAGKNPDWDEVLRLALVTGALAAAGYLKQSPLPPANPPKPQV